MVARRGETCRPAKAFRPFPDAPARPTVNQVKSPWLDQAPPVRQLRFDVDARPFLVLFELTRACALACRHCRAEAHPGRDPDELSTAEIRAVLDDLASIGAPRPRVVLTGGDPLERPDLQTLVAHGANAGLSMAISPAGTPRATASTLGALRHAGATAVSFSLDAATAEAHDDFRRVQGSFEWTVHGCRSATEVGLRLQVNTTVTAATVLELPALSRLVTDLHAARWSVFFVVPTGRADATQALSAESTEDTLAFLHDVAQWVRLKTTEAPTFRRLAVHKRQGITTRAPGPLYVELHRRLADAWPVSDRPSGARTGPAASTDPRRRAPLAVADGRGVVFVSHTGDVQPSGFLRLVVGNVREKPLTQLYAGAPLLRALRDPSALRGRCGRCELREICGGSRAQAYARHGDPLGEDPTCDYDPSVSFSPTSPARPFGFEPPGAAPVEG